MARNPTQNLSSPLLKLHPCTFLPSSWEFPSSSSSPPALVCVTATALIPQQVFALVLFGEVWMLLCQMDQRPAKLLKDQTNMQRRNLCLAWAEPVRWMRACSGVGLWQEELEHRAEDASGCKKSALELCWLLGQAPPALQNSALHFTGKQTKPKCEHFRGQSGNNGMSTGGV